MVRTLAFQAEDAGSIPVIRSIFGEYGRMVYALVCGASLCEFKSRYSPHLVKKFFY